MTSFLVSEPTGPPLGPRQEGLGDLETLHPTASGCHPAHRAMGHKTLLIQGKGVRSPVLSLWPPHRHCGKQPLI